MGDDEVEETKAAAASTTVSRKRVGDEKNKNERKDDCMFVSQGKSNSI